VFRVVQPVRNWGSLFAGLTNNTDKIIGTIVPATLVFQLVQNYTTPKAQTTVRVSLVNNIPV
jgi:hypothetical protein